MGKIFYKAKTIDDELMFGKLIIEEEGYFLENDQNKKEIIKKSLVQISKKEFKAMNKKNS